MKTNHEFENVEHVSHTKSVLAGLLVGGLVGAGTMLLMAPQAGERTRAELQEGVSHLRDRTTETVKDRVTQVKSRAYQLKADVQTMAEELQYQGKDVLARQLDRVSQAAEAGKKAIQGS
ncbi:MAG: YtxH domain-containing protein [Anaerolineae bacterium]|nr:YtxH domain-containing protein [Anaerolineae bacterium]MCI0609560.1 YtxH domain-containing protein [Anaerolineae bacterium]